MLLVVEQVDSKASRPRGAGTQPVRLLADVGRGQWEWADQYCQPGGSTAGELVLWARARRARYVSLERSGVLVKLRKVVADTTVVAEVWGESQPEGTGTVVLAERRVAARTLGGAEVKHQAPHGGLGLEASDEGCICSW